MQYFHSASALRFVLKPSLENPLWLSFSSSSSSSSSPRDSWNIEGLFFCHWTMFVFFFSEMKLYFCTRASLLLRTICGGEPFRAYWDKTSWDWQTKKKKKKKRIQEEEMKDIGQWRFSWREADIRSYPRFSTEPWDIKKSLRSEREKSTRNQQSQNQLNDGTRSSEDTQQFVQLSGVQNKRGCTWA